MFLLFEHSLWIKYSKKHLQNNIFNINSYTVQHNILLSPHWDAVVLHWWVKMVKKKCPHAIIHVLFFLLHFLRKAQRLYLRADILRIGFYWAIVELTLCHSERKCTWANWSCVTLALSHKWNFLSTKCDYSSTENGAALCPDFFCVWQTPSFCCAAWSFYFSSPWKLAGELIQQ